MNTPLITSYRPEDCQFLLQPINVEYKDVAEKERLIQSGELHYSEMINRESAPTQEYLDLFYEMTSMYSERLAKEVLCLSNLVSEFRPGFGSQEKPIVLMSLARAGTPIGVLLRRALSLRGVHSVHYSVSIIRDRGIDARALDYVRERHDEGGIVFVDGWTAKGVITGQLHQSIKEYNEQNDSLVPKEMFVVSDIGATADVAATYDDYTIPSALLNSIVSGLVSRSILNDSIGDGFHGCVVYDEFEGIDLSNWFINEVCKHMDPDNIPAPEVIDTHTRYQNLSQSISEMMHEYNVSDINRLKPGIAEATRVMLRRVPDLLIVRESGHPDVRHLERLAEEKNIPVVERVDIPFGACALIKDVIENKDVA